MREYTIEDVFKKSKYLNLMFSLENEEYGKNFRKAIDEFSFSKLNHFLMNTYLGRVEFPGLSYQNLYKIYEKYHEKRSNRSRWLPYPLSQIANHMGPRIHPLSVTKVIKFMQSERVHERIQMLTSLQTNYYSLFQAVGVDIYTYLYRKLDEIEEARINRREEEIWERVNQVRS